VILEQAIVLVAFLALLAIIMLVEHRWW